MRSSSGLLAYSIMRAHSANTSDGAIAKGALLEMRVGNYWRDAAPLIQGQYADRLACDAGADEIKAVMWQALVRTYKVGSAEYRVWQIGKPPRRGCAEDEAASDAQRADYELARTQRIGLQKQVSKTFGKMKDQIYGVSTFKPRAHTCCTAWPQPHLHARGQLPFTRAADAA